MSTFILGAFLFLAKVLDNALSTTKTILIQRSRWMLAAVSVVLSDFIYYWLTKRIVSADNLEAMKAFRDFLAEHHITNVAADTYTLDWNKKTISITAYPETKAENHLITEYIGNSPLKFKRVIRK